MPVQPDPTDEQTLLLHLFLRRVRSNSLLFGEPHWHRERVCAFHGLAGGAR